MTSLCVRTLENLIALGELTAHKVGTRTLIPYQALLEFSKRDHRTRFKAAEVRDAQRAE